MRKSLGSGVAGLMAVVSVVSIAVVPLSCQSGGVGDPCTPEDEYGAGFSGFGIAEAYIESRSFQCSTRICLVNHFQGRVSCPLGQSASDIHPCAGPGDTSCGAGQHCVESSTYAPACTTCPASGDGPPCVPIPCPAGLACDPTLGVCTCDPATTPSLTVEGAPYTCRALDPSCKPTKEAPCTGLLHGYVCHVPGSCQSADGSAADNQGKACCVHGTDAPVAVPVCGQCEAGKRDAATAVYCSCRCGVAEGDPPEPDFNFCTCPSGFTCSEVRPDFGLTGADKQLNGKYCVKDGTAFTEASTCGVVTGALDAACMGLAAH